MKNTEKQLQSNTPVRRVRSWMPSQPL